MKIALLTGTDAHNRLQDAGWLSAWRALAAADAKLTLLQEPEFVLPWYQAYQVEQSPVLVEGRRADGEMVALLPLALGPTGIAHAGAGQAEYHGWIAHPEHDQEFPVQALLALHEKLGLKRWEWRWLPPGTESTWCASPVLAHAGLHVVTECSAAPIWNLADGEKLAKPSTGRSLRSKANRYRRRGDYRLERIKDGARTLDLLPILASQCDFRQEVVHDVRPFADDPRKADFYARRQTFPEANHFTVLWCGDEPLAFHFGACNGSVCLLGLSAFSPSESRNSPGTLHMVELAHHLVDEHFACFDLTPGHDPYKQRFANARQELVRLTMHDSQIGRLRAIVRTSARNILVTLATAGNQAARERLKRQQRNFQSLSQELTGNGMGAFVRGIKRRFHQPRKLECLVYGEAAALHPSQVDCLVRLQAWEDLLLPCEDPQFATRRSLLADALARFSVGQILYSVRTGDRLVQFAWRVEAASYGRYAERLLSEERLQEGDTLLCVFPGAGASLGIRRDQALQACITRMIADRKTPQGKRVRLCAGQLDPAARSVLTGLGFREAQG